MVRNCPCKGARCSCYVDGTGGLNFRGNGSERQPYSAEWALPELVAEDSDQADIAITGAGEFVDPFIVSITTLGGSVDQRMYKSDDTWNKPSGGTVAQVVVIGGGGGGGSAAPNAEAGGSGGAGGAMSVAWFVLDELPDSVDIKVGAGGRGGRPIAGETNAKSGGRSWFGKYLIADGGRGGTSQANPSQTQHTTIGGTPPEGGPGGAGAVRDGSSFIPAETHGLYLSPTGGGMGTGTLIVGASNCDVPGLLVMESWGGEGGAGGNTSIVGPSSFPGEDGNLYGGGGGGGASDTDDSWAGGAGADGIVVVTVW